MGRPAARVRQSSLLAPATVLAFNSVPSYIEACRLEPQRYGEANVVVACDPATVVADRFKGFASGALCDGGVGAILLNGGRAGASARAWVRREAPSIRPVGGGAAAAAPAQHASHAALLAASDASLGLVEVEGFAGGATTDGERYVRDAFDRSSLACFERSRAPQRAAQAS